ncbi:MAG TPA: ATP-binding protein [Flavisolibacter sp.]|nr:ATP-binding protein [Flavisolibacter sp.]
MITSILTFIVLVVGFFVFIKKYQSRRLLHMQEKQALQARFQQELLQTQLEIQEQTFHQISQEIHDNIGQVLSLVRLNVNRLSSAGNEEKIVQTDRLLGQAITDLRQLSHNLNADYLQRTGLVEALAQLLTNLERTGKFTTSFSCSADVHLKDEAIIILYRIVQETINNIIKHADASHVSISIEEANGLLSIVVADNGKGFDTAVVKGGIGLTNMVNRARMIGASVDMKSEINTGTSVTITVKSTA